MGITMSVNLKSSLIQNHLKYTIAEASNQFLHAQNWDLAWLAQTECEFLADTKDFTLWRIFLYFLQETRKNEKD